MDARERDRQRQEILGELTLLLREHLALAAWGRLLVFVERRPDGSLRVSDLQVEEILDDAAVERAFDGEGARASLPALASAVEALTLLDELDVDELGGGTFVRGDDAAFWIAGCVRTPSKAFDDRRDGALARVREKNASLLERFEIGGAALIDADMLAGTARALVGGVPRASAAQLVIGSFSRRRRSWVWGAHNPTLVDEARRRAAVELDALRDRSMWEVSTQGFVTDEPTAWALAALLADERGLDGIARVDTKEGFVLLGLRGVEAASVP